ncbi:MAG: TonB-dependent receptor [Bacteroidota bacterium]
MIILLLCSFSSSVIAQGIGSSTVAVLSGTVELQEEPAIGATVQIQGLELFAVTDAKGAFSIANLPFGEHTVQISYVGSAPFRQTVLIDQKEVAINFVLEENAKTLEEIIDTKRFHNEHFSAFVEATATLRDLRWADRLSFSASYSNRDDQIQHGRVIQPVAIGAASQEIETLSQRIDYRKRLLNNKLSIRYFGLLSYTKTFNRDSTLAIFNWRGEQFQSLENATGSEIFPIPNLREGENIGTAHRFTASYEVLDNLTLTLSDFYRFTEITGEDPVGVRINVGGEAVDPNTIPSRLWRNIFGVGLKQTFWEEKLTAIAFYKNYYYKAESIDILQRGGTVIPTRRVDSNLNGYGLALKYQVLKSLYFRGSYEQSIRIPSEGEIFGNFAAIVPNYTIRPETSDNFNLGFKFEKPIAGLKQFSVQVDGLLRNQKDLIRLDDFGPENAIFINEAKVDGRGVEVTTTITPIEPLKFTGNFTYQSNEITTPQLAAGALSGAQVPNIPNLFYNLGVSYSFEEIFNTQGNVDLFWNYFFGDLFSGFYLHQGNVSTQSYIGSTGVDAPFSGGVLTVNNFGQNLVDEAGNLYIQDGGAIGTATFSRIYKIPAGSNEIDPNYVFEPVKTVDAGNIFYPTMNGLTVTRIDGVPAVGAITVSSSFEHEGEIYFAVATTGEQAFYKYTPGNPSSGTKAFTVTGADLSGGFNLSNNN